MAVKAEPMDQSENTEVTGAGDAMDTSESPSGKTDDSKKLLESGLKEPVVSKLDEIFKSGKLSYSELDQRAIDALKEFRSEDAVEVLKQFQESSLDHVSNKSAYLSGIMKTFRQKSKVPGSSVQGSKGPDEEKIKAILERTSYTLDVTTGQRKYGGPPPDWDNKSPPPSGSEVFVGKIPKDIFEDELIPLFEQCGTIWDLRLMMDPLTGQNRGFAFITFTSKEEAQKAVRQLDNYEIKKGKELKVNVSVPNLRLFVGNIPKDKSKEEIFEEFSKLTAGLVDVIIYSSPDDKKKNRGFCFLEYECHKSASLAKRRLGTGRVKVWSCDIIVDWADPQEEPDEETMSKVKVLYARNLTSDITEEKLKEMFEKHGKVERVKKIKDYAFIHFEERNCAVKAMEDLNNADISGGAKLSVSLAKPPSDKKKKEEMLRNRERRMMQTMQSRALMMGMPMPPVPPMGRGGRGRMPPPPDPRNYEYDYEYYGYGDYQGGYADPYYEDYYGSGGGGYEDYYDYPGYSPAPPPGPPPQMSRGRGRGGQDRGRGALRGARGTWRTPTAASAARGRAATTRGRGTRGTMRGLGMNLNAPSWGANQRGNLAGKRKFDGGHQNQGDSKRRFQNKGSSNSAWGNQPLAQQPLRYSEDSWYQDSYGSHWA